MNQAQCHNQTIQNQLLEIDALNLECIIFKLVRSQEWSLEEANEGVRQYKMFLRLIAKNRLEKKLSDGIAPFTNTIDEVWHAHILDTQKYFDDCERIFGEYIHHYPYSGMIDEMDVQDQKERLGKTLAFCAEEFGEIPIEIDKFLHHKKECEQCENCEVGQCGKPCDTKKILGRRRPALIDLSIQ